MVSQSLHIFPSPVHLLAGTVAPPGDFGEATLDIELVMGLLGPKQNVTVYQVGDVEQPSTLVILCLWDYWS